MMPFMPMRLYKRHDLCTTAAMGMTITNCWKLFRYGVKRDHYDKLIGIRKFLERLAQYFFSNTFSPDRGNLEKKIPPLDEVNDGDTVSTCRALHFSSCISPSTAVCTNSGMTQNSASTISIGSEHIFEKDEYKQRRRYNRLSRGCLLLLIVGNCFVMGLRETTITN